MSLNFSDALVAVVWLLVNSLLILAAWRGACMAFPGDALLERFMHAAVAAWAWIVAATILLGAVGWLSAASLLATVGGGAAALLTKLPRAPR